MELTRTNRGVEIDWDTIERLTINYVCINCGGFVKMLERTGIRITKAYCTNKNCSDFTKIIEITKREK